MVISLLQIVPLLCMIVYDAPLLKSRIIYNFVSCEIFTWEKIMSAKLVLEKKMPKVFI